MKKIAVSNATTAPGVTGPTNHSSQAVWFYRGETYVVDTHPFVEYATSRGAAYTISTVASAPQPYLDAVAALQADGVTVKLGGPLRDAANPIT